MPERINAAHRLDQVLSEAASVAATTRTMDPWHMLPGFPKITQKAGTRKHTLHALRHTAATLLLQQGTHPTLVQHLLGHASVGMTLDKYSHWLPSMGEATAQAMESALG
jgi:integrase